jgi:hypothetical protein
VTSTGQVYGSPAPLSAHVKWVPWRYTDADYRAALRDGNLRFTWRDTPRNPRGIRKLAVAMAECGLALEEEAVANLVAGDVLAARRS